MEKSSEQRKTPEGRRSPERLTVGMVVRGTGFEPSDSYETRHLPSAVPGGATPEVLNLAPLAKLSHPRTGDELGNGAWVFGLFERGPPFWNWARSRSQAGASAGGSLTPST